MVIIQVAYYYHPIIHTAARIACWQIATMLTNYNYQQKRYNELKIKKSCESSGVGRLVAVHSGASLLYSVVLYLPVAIIRTMEWPTVIRREMRIFNIMTPHGPLACNDYSRNAANSHTHYDNLFTFYHSLQSSWFGAQTKHFLSSLTFQFPMDDTREYL